MNKLHLLIALIAAAVVVLLIGYFVIFGGTDSTTTETISEPPTEDPLDVVNEFYNAWLSASLSTSTNVTEAGLLTSEMLSPAMQTRIAEALASTEENTLDPVACQLTIPERMGGKILFAQPTEAQVMMLARGLEERSPYQAVVTLTAVAGKWQISDIACSQGEIAPVKDFDFEREGFLLKSVPPPLNPDFWHLVYEENGQMGRTVPLTVNENSICVQPNGDEAPCNEADFRDATKVFLRADMSESGATIRRLEF